MLVLRKVQTLIKSIYAIPSERKNEENSNFVHIVYILAKLCNIFGEALLLTSVYVQIS